MVRVWHYLKDGAQVDSVAGRVVRYEDCPGVYQALDGINKRYAKEMQHVHKKEAKQHAERHQSNR